MVVQYKCPTCGSDLSYDIEKNSLLCAHCGLTARIEDMPPPEIPEGEEDHNPDVTCYDTEKIENDQEIAYSDDGTHEPGQFDENAVEYHCQNCGAVIVTDNNTAATWCHYCDSPVVLGDRLTGQLAPVYVIPFVIDKEQAKQAFYAWCKKGLFTPKKFKQAQKIKDLSGIYIPFWLFDLNGSGDADATCTKVRTYTMGNYIYTETKYFHVYRRATANYLKIPADASEKMNDTIMDLLEPFDYKGLKKFQMPYLAGYTAEKYSYDDQALLPRVKPRVEQYVKEYLRESIKGYSTVSYNRESVDVKQIHADYTLFPVWMFSYNYEDKDHMFIMNAQTGKIVGKAPISAAKVMLWWAGISVVVFGVMKALSLFL